MLTALLWPVGEPPRVLEGDQGLRPPGPRELLWLDAQAPSAQELSLLRERFELHPVAVEDCGRVDLRPRLEEYEQQLFVVVHRLLLNDRPDEVAGIELHTFLGERYLLTVHQQPLPELDSVRERVLRDASLRARGLAFVYYVLCERIAHENFAALEVLFDAVETIEDSVLKQEDADALPELFAAKRRLASARRLIVPQRDVISVLLESTTPFVDDAARPYFRRVLDPLMRMAEAIDTQREILSNVLEAHLSLVSNRTNDIMKSLTLLSAIFLPLTFVTGFFGQNFVHLPFQSTGLMWLGLALCLVLPIGMVAWFKSRKWM